LFVSSQAEMTNSLINLCTTNTKAEELKSQKIIEAYKNQNASIERGFCFLKDPQLTFRTKFLML